MAAKLTIAALVKQTWVPSKTLRTGKASVPCPSRKQAHRLFEPEIIQQVEFIQKAKSIGLA